MPNKFFPCKKELSIIVALKTNRAFFVFLHLNFAALKNYTPSIFLCISLLVLGFCAKAQTGRNATADRPLHRCATMESLEETIKKDPSVVETWRQEGERQWAAYLKRASDGRLGRTQAGEIVIPLVFHLVDAATTLAGITDRDIYEQVEILNRDFGGFKLDAYKNVIPADMAARVGRIPVRFTLARRTPSGALTSGIERRTNATPSRVAIKSLATGGLDAWDTSRYVNVWSGTFSGADNGLLGIATFPFTGSTEGAQGVVIGISTLPYTSPTSRSYYPTYSEGATLSHELGHYFYLWHTFGDANACNNQDFRIQSGWPLPTGAGPEGDDTPSEGAAPNGVDLRFGNPSMSYTDGCSPTPPGIMYESFMNYFDDRALFMFSDGMRKRVLGCIDAYRPGLKTSNGATPPSSTTDAYLVNVSPRGLIERRSFLQNNSPMTATVRNLGTTTLTSVTVNVVVGTAAPVATTFALSLAAGNDTTLALPALSVATAGNYTLTAYVSAPAPGSDAFLHNDTLYSFVNVATTTVAVTSATPFTEDFSSAPFPNSAKFRIFNPNGSTWTRSATSGFAAAGSAFFDNYSIAQYGTLDELITLPLNLGAADSSLLSFNVAYTRFHDLSFGVDSTDPSRWDGLEVYVSANGGVTYNLVYKKTGDYLQTAAAASAAPFIALPTEPNKWRTERINLSPYLVGGKTMLVKFRNTNAKGQGLYLDDIAITAANKPQYDLQAVRLNNLPDITCASSLTPSLTVKDIGSQAINNFRLTYWLDNGAPVTSTVTATVNPSQETTVTLPTLTLTPGTHLLTVVANLPNGINDAYPLNDTLRKIFVVPTTVNAPLVESFEGTGTILNGLPDGWALINPDGNTSWARTGKAVRKIANSDSASVYVRNFGYAANATDDLYTPKISVSSADSVFVKFDLAAVTYNYPGATATNQDTLEVLLSKDCGATLTSVYKKWGTELQTLGAPNDPTASEFTPGFTQNWRRDSINLTPYVSGTSIFQVVFRSSHNAPGNNIFLDNVNVYSRILPAALKQQGYLVLPTAFTSIFRVWHYTQPTALTGINVYNSIGQLVWSKQYYGNADRTVYVDMSGKAAGIYFVNLRYTDANNNVTQKVIKY